MIQTKIQQLKEKYPFIVLKQKSYVEPWRPVGSTWIDEFIGTGWEQLVINFCEEATRLFSKELLSYWEWGQCKEKWGNLRIYSSPSIDAPEEVVNEWFEKESQYRSLCWKYDQLTHDTCFFCGEPATTHELGGWYIGQCDECHEREMAKRIYKFEISKNL